MIVPIYNQMIFSGVRVHCQDCEEIIGVFCDERTAKEILTKMKLALSFTAHGNHSGSLTTHYYCPEHAKVACKR